MPTAKDLSGFIVRGNTSDSKLKSLSPAELEAAQQMKQMFTDFVAVLTPMTISNIGDRFNAWKRSGGKQSDTAAYVIPFFRGNFVEKFNWGNIVRDAKNFWEHCYFGVDKYPNIYSFTVTHEYAVFLMKMLKKDEYYDAALLKTFLVLQDSKYWYEIIMNDDSLINSEIINCNPNSTGELASTFVDLPRVSSSAGKVFVENITNGGILTQYPLLSFKQQKMLASFCSDSFIRLLKNPGTSSLDKFLNNAVKYSHKRYEALINDWLREALGGELNKYQRNATNKLAVDLAYHDLSTMEKIFEITEQLTNVDGLPVQFFLPLIVAITRPSSFTYNESISVTLKLLEELVTQENYDNGKLGLIVDTVLYYDNVVPKVAEWEKILGSVPAAEIVMGADFILPMNIVEGRTRKQPLKRFRKTFVKYFEEDFAKTVTA